MTSIIICGRKFTISYVTNAELNKKFDDIGWDKEDGPSVLNGGCFIESQEILVNSYATSEQFKLDVIFHEAMHAVLQLHTGSLNSLLRLDEEACIRLLVGAAHEVAKVYYQVYTPAWLPKSSGRIMLSKDFL